MVDLFRLNVHGLTPVPRKGMVMRTQTELDLAAKYPRGVEIVRGKTKAVIRITSSVDLAALVSADDITAGDGAKHDVILGKGQLCQPNNLQCVPAAQCVWHSYCIRRARQPKLFRCYPLQNAPV